MIALLEAAVPFQLVAALEADGFSDDFFLRVEEIRVLKKHPGFIDKRGGGETR